MLREEIVTMTRPTARYDRSAGAALASAIT